MSSTAVVAGDTSTIVADEERLSWGIVLAGAAAAIAVTFFLLTLGSGVGLVLASPRSGAGLLAAGAIYFFASQAFGFTVGGYLVGRLIGPEVETRKEEEFRAAANGFTMWAVTIVASLVIVGVSSTMATSTLVVGTLSKGSATSSVTTPSRYWLDLLFRPAQNSALVDADKAEAGRILLASAPLQTNDADTARIAKLVSQDTEISITTAISRVTDIEARMNAKARATSDAARKAAAALALWTAFALLFGAVVAVASAISARWMDDKISFSFAPRRRA
jgi:hypothetical protein